MFQHVAGYCIPAGFSYKLQGAHLSAKATTQIAVFSSKAIRNPIYGAV